MAVPTSLPKCPACACGQKTTLRAPRWRSSSGSAPTQRPVRQRNGLAVTEEWLGKTTGDPATHGGAGDPASVREQCVGTPRGAGDPEPADGGIRTECARRGHLSRRSLSFSRNLRAGELSEVTPGPATFEVCRSPACRNPSARQLTGPEGREWFSKLSGSLLCHPDLVARRVTLDAACCRLDDALFDVIITDSLRALGLSRSLRYRVRTGTRLRL